MVQLFPPNPVSSVRAIIKGVALAGVMAFGFALGLAWEHRGHTSGFVSWISGQSLAWRLAQSQAEITTPKTGWAARLEQCHTNAATLEGSLSTARDRLGALSDKSADMVARSEKAAGEALRAANRAGAVASEILARTPASPDLCISAEQLIRDYR